MPYTIISKATGPIFTCATASETINRATDLISRGIRDVYITDERDRKLTPAEFYNSVWLEKR